MTRRYLLVDDNRALAENLAEILRDTGADAEVANDGTDALARVKARRFDAVVTDMRMPVMNGARLVHQFRRVDPDLPPLVITAYTGEADLEDARREGLLAVLPKPVPVEELIGLLGRARRGGLVAVVEDDLQMADNLSEVLRQRGFTAVAAASLLETDRLDGLTPFAAIVDLSLPDARQGEVLAALRRRLPEMSLWAVTGHPELAQGLKPSHLFIKPFDTHRLLAALEAEWERRQGPLHAQRPS